MAQEDGSHSETDAASPPVALVAEDDARTRAFLRSTLASGGFRVIEALTGAAVLAESSLQKPDVVMLGRHFGDMNVLALTTQLRESMTEPIFIVSALASDDEKVAALEAGANDYVTRPYSARLLLARVRAWQRHRGRGADRELKGILELDDLRIDCPRRQVFVGAKPVHLTPTEYRLLILLIRNADKVLEYRRILEAIWGPECLDQVQYLHVYVRSLRRKIEADPSRPTRLRNEAGVGYGIHSSGKQRERCEEKCKP